ncbi:ABC transporter permease [Pontibacter toksunensis]|uniref:ABC transporter permease n=1 Tax=Pontibacter toksunensis TaxID=1332631 RepID=A0ABW6BR17_9BACT
MLKKIYLSFSLALQNIRARLFHTLLSILGIVIGVAALVTVLSLIDGMEKYAQDQITRTTSLNAIFIQTETTKLVNNLRFKKETYAFLDHDSFRKLAASLTHPAKTYMQMKQSSEIKVVENDSTIGSFVIGTMSAFPPDMHIAYGGFYTEDDVNKQKPVAFVNHLFAEQAMGENAAKSLMGKTIAFNNKTLKVVGILEEEESRAPELYMPITLFSREELKENPPLSVLEAENVEHVQGLKAQAEKWLKANLAGDPTDFKVATNEGRVEQAAKGFMLFRVVMGLIVGISVIVGGVGVMNVLLISVTERTVEIGVRKAMGAKKQDILLQFLAESVTVSLLGSFLGLVLGILATLAFVPIIKAFADVPFQAAYTLDTFLIISVVAIIVGVVFGTYPATRAAKLDPVEAIRRE